MNIPRRIAALQREVKYRESELERIADLRAAQEPTVLAFPKLVDKYLAHIQTEIEVRKNQIRDLEEA